MYPIKWGKTSRDCWPRVAVSQEARRDGRSAADHMTTWGPRQPHQTEGVAMLHGKLTVNKFVLGVLLITTVALLPALAAPAEAGCIREWQGCGECASKAYWRALRRLDPKGAGEAFADAIDCDIDLFHCVAMAVHHNYVCAV